MRFQETQDPNVLATRYGSILPNIFFSLLSFAIGLPAMIAGLGLFGWEAEAPPAASFLVGAALLVLGIGLLTYRRGFIVDKRRGLLTHWRSSFGLRHREAIPLSRVRRVILRCERRITVGSNSDRSKNYTVFPVCLDGEHKSFRLADELSLEAARGTAEHASRILDIPIVDRSDRIVLKDEWF
jgi:hypothetical protein